MKISRTESNVSNDSSLISGKYLTLNLIAIWFQYLILKKSWFQHIRTMRLPRRLYSLQIQLDFIKEQSNRIIKQDFNLWWEKLNCTIIDLPVVIVLFKGPNCLGFVTNIVGPSHENIINSTLRSTLHSLLFKILV